MRNCASLNSLSCRVLPGSLRRRFLLHAKQRAHGHAEQAAHGHKLFNFGQSAVALPFGDRLARYAERFSQRFLRKVILPAQFCNALSNGHIPSTPSGRV